MVDKATLDDIPRLLPLVEEFSKEIGLDEYYDIKTSAATLAECIRSGICYRDSEYQGLIAGSAVRSPWSSKVSILHEHVYFVRATARGGMLGQMLLRAYTTDAKRWDLNSLKLMSSSPDIKKLYKSLGFTEAETTFMRFNGG